MRFEILFLGLGLAGQAYAQTCGWFLDPNDCICMMSTTGGLLKDQTGYCCRAMGYKMSSNVCVQFPRGLGSENVGVGWGK